MNEMQKVVGLCCVLFTAIGAYLLFSRLDQNTLTVITGVVIGVAFTSPAGIAIGYLIGHRRNEPQSVTYHVRPQAQVPQFEPPAYYLPPMLNTSNRPAPLTQRNHIVIGEDGNDQPL